MADGFEKIGFAEEGVEGPEEFVGHNKRKVLEDVDCKVVFDLEEVMIFVGVVFLEMC